jgi:hypothetical protein
MAAKTKNKVHEMLHAMREHHGGGDHMHIHGHDEGYTTHHLMEDGEVKGPHEHKNMGALKKHVAATMDCDADGM